MELWMENHTGRTQYPRYGKPQRASLPGGTLRPANNILILAFHPEVRRIVRKVGKNRDVRHARPDVVQGLFEGAIVVGDQLNDQVRPVLRPMLFQRFDLRAVAQPDH